MLRSRSESDIMLMRLFGDLQCSRRTLAQVSPSLTRSVRPPSVAGPVKNICQTQPPPLATACIALATVSRQALLMPSPINSC